MIDLILLYKWTIVSGAASAVALSLLGTQLATRERSMQTLCVSQGATVGVLLGMALFTRFHHSPLQHIGPLLFAILTSVLTLIISDHLVKDKTASRNTYFAFIFATLLACGHLVSSVFAALESHMAQIYFGDLVTLSTAQAQINFIIAAVGGLLLILFRNPIVNGSFENSVFGGNLYSGFIPSEMLFKVVSLLLLSLSVQFLGFLFTVAVLFVPTCLANSLKTKGLRVHLSMSVFLAVAGTISGFILSLHFSRMPTVPVIVAVMLILGVTSVAVERVYLRIASSFTAKNEATETETGLNNFLTKPTL